MNSTLQSLVDRHYVDLFRVASCLTASDEQAVALTCSAFRAVKLVAASAGADRIVRLSLLRSLCMQALCDYNQPKELSFAPGVLLEARHRACIALHHLENLSPREIADVISLKPMQVSRSLGEAKQLLRDRAPGLHTPLALEAAV